MRTLLATAIVLGGLSALNSATEAAPKSKRNTQFVSVECQRAQNEDPSGQFAGYPCWAREMFARGSGTGGGID
jgi:hypothetical protein